MFDTMTITKVVGGFCGAFLIFLLGAWAGELIYHVGGHGDGEQAYSVEVPETDASDGGAEEEQVPFEELMASADASAGEGVFRACRSCHAVEPGDNGVGPSLHGVVGRDIAAVDGFNYSGALVEQADVWTPENLNAFLEAPSDWAPGTAMAYRGLSDPQDRANIIAWLDENDA